MGEEKLPLPPPPPPLLLTTHGGEKFDKQSFYNLLENRYHTTYIPVLNNKSVLCSAYGWLVLLDQTNTDSVGECCLWNPTSSEIIELPVVEKSERYNRCFLSKPPTDPDCFIVFSHFCCQDQFVYRFQDNATFTLNVAKQGHLMSMVSFQGMIYGVVKPLGKSSHEFATIHMVGDEFEAKPLLTDDQLPWEVPQGVRSWNGWNQVYLMESPCGNEIFLVIKLWFNSDLDCTMHFRVFRVDVGRMECEELENLDGKTVFIGYYGNGFCRSSESFGTAIKQNSIYYTNVNGSAFYVYDMDDRSLVTLSPYPKSGINPFTEDNFWVDLSDIPRKNRLYFADVSSYN